MKIKLISVLFILANTFLQAQTQKTLNSFTVSINGNGEETLFLIPGLSCSGNVWNETINKFKDRFTIHTFTLAGYAGVEPIKKDSILPVITKDLINYINQYKSKNSIIMGHSIGGFMTLLIALEDNNIASKLILVDTLPFLAGATNPQMTQEVMQSSFSYMRDTYLKFDDEMLKQNLKNTLSTMIREKSNVDFVLKDAIKSDRRTLGVTMFEMLSNDLREKISKIKIPTMIFTNWNTTIPQMPNVTKASKLSLYKQQYAKCISCKVKVIEQAEHFIMLDNPVVFQESVQDFINN